MIDLKIKKLHPDAKIPQYATDGSAGLDLTCVSIEDVFPCTYKKISESTSISTSPSKYCTGLAMEIPKGYVGLLFPRSSVFKTKMSMANCVGVIDSDYRGEVSAIFYTDNCYDPYEVGDRCCQLVLMKLPEVNIVEVDELSETERGSGGYGSTGK